VRSLEVAGMSFRAVAIDDCITEDSCELKSEVELMSSKAVGRDGNWGNGCVGGVKVTETPFCLTLSLFEITVVTLFGVIQFIQFYAITP
jgi:hypothetical protein